VRQELFSDLEEALAARDTVQVRRLLARVNTVASHKRTADEITIADVAAAYVADQQQAYVQRLRAHAEAQRAEQEEARARRAAGRVQSLLATLQQRGDKGAPKTTRKLVRELVHAASDAGDHIDAGQQEQINAWKTRAEVDKPPAQTARPATSLGAPQATRHQHVARRYWIKKRCPRCKAVAGRYCVTDVQTNAVSTIPHYERIAPILAQRQAKADRRRRAPGA